MRYSKLISSSETWATLCAAALVCSAALLTTGPAFATTPKTILSEGVIRATGGGAAADGSYAMTFSLYNKAVGGLELFKEGPISLNVSGGRFQRVLGKVVTIGPAVFTAPEVWLGVKIGNEPELPRTMLHSVPFALRSGMAEGLACSGCVAAGALAPGAITAKSVAASSINASKVSFTYAGSKTKGGAATNLSCTGCVSVSELLFDADVDLKGRALTAGKLTVKGDTVVGGTVAAKKFLGDGSSLTGIKTPAGKCAKVGEVVKGINPDGSLQCVVSMEPSALPSDGLDEISGGLLTNQFVHSTASAKTPVAIPDNNPGGAVDLLVFPDVGFAQSLDVIVNINTSNTKQLAVSVKDPAGKVHVLHSKTGSAKAVAGSWPSKNKLVSGNLKAWVGKNAKGNWTLSAVDSAFLNNKIDGVIASWSVRVKAQSNQKVEATKDLVVSGVLHANGGLKYKLAPKPPIKCDAANTGYTYYDTGLKALMFCNGKVFFALFLANPGTIENPGLSCKDILTKQPAAKTGLHYIDPDGSKGAPAFEVYCDMTTDGGGWTLMGTIFGGDKNNWTTEVGYWGDTKTLGSAKAPWVDYKSQAWSSLNIKTAEAMWERRYDKVIKGQAKLSNKCLFGKTTFRELFATWDVKLHCSQKEIKVLKTPSDAAGLAGATYAEGAVSGLDGSGTNGWCWNGGDSNSNIFKGHAGWNQSGYSGCYEAGHLSYIGVFSINSSQYQKLDIDYTNWMNKTTSAKTAVSFYVR